MSSANAKEKLIFLFRFRLTQLGLSDFKTGPFSCLHIINAIFSDDLFFRILLKQLIYYWLLSAKYKNSKSIIKGMIKSELWKEQIKWKMGTALNNDKNINDFCLKPLLKTERHISLKHLNLLSTKKILY